MKKSLLAMTALAAMLFAGCTSSDELTTLESIKQAENAPAPISFGTYVGKAGATRAGFVGDITDTELKSSTEAKGFGVFAYYTGNTDFPNVTAAATPAPGSILPNSNKPNFMYNQQVSWNGSTALWTYSPLKYWPNDFASTAVDVPGAIGSSTYGGKLSFFAYAPYVTKAAADADASAGTGIIGMSANSAGGNPTITYKMASTGKNVDLVWGTCPTDANGTYNIAPSGTQTGGWVWGNESSVIKSYGKTNVNLTKQTTNATETSAEKVNFLFKHSLAKVGGSTKGSGVSPTAGLQIKLDPDFGTSFGAGQQTVVTVHHITISQDDDQTTPSIYDHSKKNKGVLDLATGIWDTSTGEQDLFSQTIKTGASADNEAELNPNIKEQSVNTTVDLVSNANWINATNGLVDGTHVGVLTTAQPVYDETNPVKPLLYFPGETPAFNVEIEYVVRTKDPNLENGYSEVSQKITKKVIFPGPVEMNKRYNIMIILGLTSVKFEATVDNWTIMDSTGDWDGDSSNDDGIVNLPLNVQ